MLGYVYLLTNPAMPGLVKVGRSRSKATYRAGQLYTPGVPLPFVVCVEKAFFDCVAGEKYAHELLAEKRINPRREFFECDVSYAAMVIDMAAEVDTSNSQGNRPASSIDIERHYSAIAAEIEKKRQAERKRFPFFATQAAGSK